MTLIRIPLHALVASSLLLVGCVTTSRESPPSTAPKGEVIAAAKAIQNAAPGRMAGIGQGESMAPFYGDNTVLVTTPIDFKELERGMIVAYRTSWGNTVVHRLSHQQGRHWVAHGVNNMGYDRELVTPDNLIGVVYATFRASE